MWNVTQTDSYHAELKKALEAKWRLVSSRLESLSAFQYSRFEPSSVHLDDLLTFWMDKRSGLQELRNFIDSKMNSVNSNDQEFGRRVLTFYINRVSAEFNGKPELLLDSIEPREKLRGFSADVFRGADYQFLNTLFACFPEVIFNTPGIMQGAWQESAFLPENAGSSTLALIAGYQTYLVHRTHSMFGESAIDKFNNGFKSAFGTHPDHMALRLPELDKSSEKVLLRYVKKSVIRSTRDYSVVPSLRIGFSGRGLAITAVGRSGYFNNADVAEGLTRYTDSDRAATLLQSYLNYKLAPLHKLGKLFEETAVSSDVVKRLLGDETAEDIDYFRRFLAGFSQEDCAKIQIRTQFPPKYLTGEQSKRMVLTQDLGL